MVVKLLCVEKNLNLLRNLAILCDNYMVYVCFSIGNVIILTVFTITSDILVL